MELSVGLATVFGALSSAAGGPITDGWNSWRRRSRRAHRLLMFALLDKGGDSVGPSAKLIKNEMHASKGRTGGSEQRYLQ